MRRKEATSLQFKSMRDGQRRRIEDIEYDREYRSMNNYLANTIISYRNQI